MIGGMGVDISSSDLALEAARLGGVGHISDAMIKTVTDRRYKTKYVKAKQALYKYNVDSSRQVGREVPPRRPGAGHAAARRAHHVAQAGSGLVFINCMEKLTMNSPKETLAVRHGVGAGRGIDGITLAAGLHLGSFALIESHPRFRDAKLGIIVSSLRALQLFLKKNARLNRLPDYVVVEGPLAGGHLGFGMDWASYDLATIMAEIDSTWRSEQLSIPVIPAGGIFTGSDAVRFMEAGAAAVQVATRFTVTRECGLPDEVKQEYFKADEDDIEVNQISPTGYPMRMIKSSPGIGDGIRPNCEAYGYLLDANGKCAYITAYNREVALHPDARKRVGAGQDLPVHAHAQLRDLDLRPDRVAAEGHLAAARRWQLPAAERRTCVPRLPVQHRHAHRAAPALIAGTPRHGRRPTGRPAR
jgi:nitronate monooxygenase